MKMIDRYLLKDYTEGFYNVILFNEKINVDELQDFIKKVKIESKDEIGESNWNIESITDRIINKFNVKEVLYFDYMSQNIGDIVGDCFLEIL